MNRRINCKRVLCTALALVLALGLCAAPALAADPAPDDGLATRGDVVKWLYQDLGKGEVPVGTSTFTDVTADDGVAEAAAWAAELGIVKGYGDGRFGPNDFVTREQAATMLYRFVQTKGRGFRGAWMFLLDYPDAAEISEWANEAMHWVVMNHVITERDGVLAPQDYIGVNELPVWIRNLDDALNVKLENGGYTLAIPTSIANQLNTELPADVPEGTLFAVAEQASIDAASKLDPDYTDGAGWLFAIQKISEEEAHKLLCGDMSGMELFAKDAEGNHFLFCHPTDVRFFRDTTEEMLEDTPVWTKLNEWAAMAKDRFINDNGLIPDAHGNTDVEIALYRVAYDPDVKYTLSTTQFGPLEPDESVDAAAYALSALRGVTFEYADGEEAPDGEYVVLKLEDGDRFDFFIGEGGNYVRRVLDLGEDETYEYLSKAVYEDEAVSLHDTMQEWYTVLAAAHGLSAE